MRTHRVIAHWKAHDGPVGALGFDLSGCVLVTADQRAFKLHVYRIVPGAGAGAASHQLLYALNRGLTSASIQSLAFSPDTRWLGVTTGRGTTHIYPVHPCGGPLSEKTHVSPLIENHPSFIHAGPQRDAFTIRHDQSVDALGRVKVHAYSLKNGATTSASATQSTIPCAACFVPVPGPAGGELGLMIASKTSTCFALRAEAEAGAEEGSLHSVKLACVPVKNFTLPRPAESRAVVRPAPPLVVHMQDPKVARRSATWLSSIEMTTYASDTAPLWHNPQFSLKQYKPIEADAPVVDVGVPCRQRRGKEETISVKIPHQELRPSLSTEGEDVSFSPDQNGMWGIPVDQTPISEDQLEEKISSAMSQSLKAGVR